MTRTDPLIEAWQAAWPEALAVWSRYTRLHDPRLCTSHVEAAKEGLSESFAMIRLVDKSVVIDLARVQAYKLEGYAVEVLAHEIGHHVLAPSTLIDHVRLLARMRKNLPTLETYAPLIANLFTDLLINDRLHREAGLRMVDIYEKLNAQRDGNPGTLWRVYMGIYETLWSRAKTSLGGPKPGSVESADAWLGAQIVRVYARDWLKGGGRFAALMMPYLHEDREAAESAAAALMDTRAAGRDGLPGGATLIDEDENDTLHPANDGALTGGGSAANPKAPGGVQGQARDPFAFGEILRASGLNISDHDAAIAYYREQSQAYVVRYPKRRLPAASDLQIEGLESWEIGESFDRIDWMASLAQSPRPVPGLTLSQRVMSEVEGEEERFEPADLDLYVDSSGSMRNPQVSISYLALAGAVIARSALKAGARVQATLWSGKSQWLGTKGFTDQETEVLRVLTGYFGGATQFPIHRMRETYRKPPERRVHILMIGDDGQSTQFDTDEKGGSGWDISRDALAKAGAGGTMALSLPSNASWKGSGGTGTMGWLERATTEQNWFIHTIQTETDLIDFARAFSRRHYVPAPEATA